LAVFFSTRRFMSAVNGTWNSPSKITCNEP
jgi:hypothetical protein